MTIVGIIANPAAGKDIRRLVAHGRTVSVDEKVNVLRRVLAGLDAVGVREVAIMPDESHMGERALEGLAVSVRPHFLDMPVLGAEYDSTRAARQMADMGVACLVTLGGDGTNRVVAKGCGRVPVVPISTGTNNVFPEMVEGTLAGLAAGVFARGLVDPANVSYTSKRLDIYVDGELRDIALVDIAISKASFVGARAIWDVGTLHEVFLTRADPASIGLSAIGAQLRWVSRTEECGLYFGLGPGSTTVLAAVAPGLVQPVPISRWGPLNPGKRVAISCTPCTIALDGEREFQVLGHERAEIALMASGPLVIDISATLREAASRGVFTIRST